MKKNAAVATLLLVVMSFTVFAKPEKSFTKELQLDTNNLDHIFIDCGSGALKLRGDNVDLIKVYAKVYSKKYSSVDKLRDVFESKMQLSLESMRSKAVLKALNKKSFISFSSPDISIDLEVVIPLDMSVFVDDGSGSMSISNLNGELEIDDGSGSISIENVDNNVKIDDGSGNLSLYNIGGDIYIDDGSGTITVNGVKGDVTVDDGSGSIIINDMQGNFHMDDDGSGSVRVNGKKWHAR